MALSERHARLSVLGLGVTMAFVVWTRYLRYGLTPFVITMWLLSIVAVGSFWVRPREARLTLRLCKRDLFILAAIVIFLAPLYLTAVYTIPEQVATDEIVMIEVTKGTWETRPLDPIANYFGYPSLSFHLFGAAGYLIGGVDLNHMRLLHALCGLACVIAAYLFFFREYLPPLLAATATLVLGINHSLIIISRMAMQHNVPLLLELIAFFILMNGLKRRSRTLLFIGGLVLGLGFHFYFSGRIVFATWFAILIVMSVVKKISFRELIEFSVVTGLAALLVANPLFVATMVQGEEAITYTRNQLLIFPEGREFQRDWEDLATVKEGVLLNIHNGLLMFNSPIHDHGNMYWNEGYGFVDPLTGALLWVGLILLLISVIRRRRALSIHVLVISAFFFTWMLMTFVVTKAPAYMRLFIMLPFIGYLVAYAMHEIASSLGRISGGKLHYRVVVCSLLIIVVGWNLLIVRRFVLKGIRDGNDVGTTGRFMAERESLDSYRWYIVEDEQHRYYHWGDGRYWTRPFIGETQTIELLAPSWFSPVNIKTPFAVMAHKDVAADITRKLRAVRAGVVVNNITSNGRLQILEVVPAVIPSPSQPEAGDPPEDRNGSDPVPPKSASP